MSKEIIYIVLFDFLIVSVLSLILALGLFLLTVPILPSLAISFVIICSGGLISNMLIQNKNKLLEKKLDNETARLYASQVLPVNCAYCKASNPQFINLNEEMTFNCIACNQPNKIVFQYGSVRVTTPLNVALPSKDLIPDEELDKVTP